MTICILRLEIAGYRTINRIERFAAWAIENEDTIKNQILITLATAAVILLIMATWQVIADSRVNWQSEPTVKLLDLGGGNLIEVICL